LLAQIAIFLLAAVIAVPLSRKLGLGAVLGFLGAGMLIGPWGLKLIEHVDAILHISEFGVVLLLFIIGLELQPSRLWALRRQVFGLGTAQVVGTALVIGLGLIALGWTWQASLVVGVGLAMSSTAFVLQTLAEKRQLTMRHGRESFAILLFQDLAVIPLLAALPYLAQSLGADAQNSRGWFDVLLSLGIVAALFASSRLLIRPFFRVIATHGGHEIFTAAALLIVVAVTLLMDAVGLTASLGAFLAGMLLADSEYRHELEADIEPFKGLLLGLFFIAIGMSVNLRLLLQAPGTIATIVLGLILLKFSILFVIARSVGTNTASARKLGLALAQGGEFAFVLFAAASSGGILDSATTELLVVAVTVSMLAAPLLFVLEDKVFSRWEDRKQPREFDTIDAPEGHVVIAGYGRVGQIVARVLSLQNIEFVALEKDADQVDTVRRFGGKLYFGDATRIELLRAANVGGARLFVLAIDDPEASMRCAELVHHHFPSVPVIARARNRAHAHLLADLGIQRFYRETWHTSLEMAMQSLLQLKFTVSQASSTIARFRDHDLALLKRQQAVHLDEPKLIQTTREASEELLSLYEADREEGATSSEEVDPPVPTPPRSL